MDYVNNICGAELIDFIGLKILQGALQSNRECPPRKSARRFMKVQNVLGGVSRMYGNECLLYLPH